MTSASDPTANDNSVDSPSTTDDGVGSQAGVVVFLSGDLIFASRVRAAAQAAGLEFQLAGNLPEQPSDQVRFILVDLSTRSKVVSGLMQSVEERFPNSQVVAHAPHVQVERLRDARQQGIPNVLTRGQFNEKLATLFDQS
ncbi:MAG: histidine kinase [Rhodopirellula sp. JB053]